MKSKIWLGLGLFIAALALGGCGNKPTTVSDTTGGTAPQEQKAEEKGGVFDSIRDAMSRSLSLKCVYTANGGQTTAYVKGKMIRVDGTYQDKQSATIIKDEKIYSWDPDKKEGVIWPITTTGEEENDFDPDKIIGDLEAQKNFCKVSTVADSQFEVPADVQFTDLGAMMQQISGMQIDTGTAAPDETGTETEAEE